MKIPKFNFLNYLLATLILWQILPRSTGVYIFDRRMNFSQLAVLLLVVFWVIKKILKRENLYLYKNAITGLVLLLIFTQTFSIIVSPNLKHSLIYWIINVLGLYAVFFIVSDQVRSIDDCRKVLKTVAYICPLIAVFACFEYLTGVNVFGESITADEILSASGRSRGTFDGPIAYGNYLSIAIFIVFYGLLLKETLRNHILWVALLIITLFALIFSYTRGSIVPIAIAFLMAPVVGFKFLNFDRSVKIIILCVFIAGTVLFFIPILHRDIDSFKEGFLTGYRGVVYHEISHGGSESGHVFGMKYVWPAILRMDRIFTGYGLGVVSPRVFDESGILANAPELFYFPNWSISLYQVLLLESGLLAFFSMILILIFSMFSLFLSARRENIYEKKIMAFTLTLAFFAYGGSLIFSMHNETLFIFFAMLGIAQYLINYRRARVIP